ncbi:MAG TPA: DNA N-6-adenine-methyltransferase [Thermoplasmata archaeon]|nr:DNA N-6-adenine-methyltransferase [Thermoplasmata archaeon]
MSDDWATPRWLLEVLFDGQPYFDACPVNPDGLRATDGLGRWPTDRPVFCNPPYSDPGPWVRKARDHPGPVVLLVKCDPSTAWWQESAHAFRVVYIGQRLRFGDADKAAPFPSAIWRKGPVAPDPAA